MDPLFIFVKAVVTGFIVAVPIGAIGALCIRRSLSGLWLDALLIGLGAALADTALGAAAFFGLTLLVGWIEGYQAEFTAIGGLVMLIFAARMLAYNKPLEKNDIASALDHVTFLSLLRDFFTGFGITIINPAPILAFAAIFAGLNIFADAAEAEWSGAGMIVVLGLFAGGAGWWCLLTFGSLALRHRLSTSIIIWINRGLGVLVLALGIFALGKAFAGYIG